MPKIHQRLADGVAEGRYDVDSVETLPDGFGAIVAAEHDVYVVDHYVGVRTGFDLLARINEEGIKAPIVFVAGASDHGTGVTAVGAGAACYIVEDAIDSDLLDRCLVQAMEQQTTLSQLNQAGVTIEGVPPTKAQILSHIADRLRNPAADILDAAHDSLMYALPAHTVESLASIEDQANGLLTLANDLVDLSMLEAGHLEFAAAEFSLRGLVSNVKRLLDPTTTARPVEIVDDVAKDVPDVLVGDPGRLRRIIARFIESVTERTSAERVVLNIAVVERNTTTVTLRFGVDAATNETPSPATMTGNSLRVRSGWPWACRLCSRRYRAWVVVFRWTAMGTKQQESSSRFDSRWLPIRSRPRSNTSRRRTPTGRFSLSRTPSPTVAQW